ncbi:MAG: 3-hydroxyacyl-CoA dehydrogenase family protein [Sandaracinaceae bacterium]|nr:3-hydroxyacyl-CoA dehydrogenase family protein [Sandaracinaceae bacterium]MDW8247645.1 3-hydroxyacyl-CoA dehydrogenase family protein [Sandaracinaceae bacterium]
MKIRKVSVIGAGTMGHGIAQACAQAGVEVSLVDVKMEQLEAALAKIENSLAKLQDKGKIGPDDARAALKRIRVSTDALEASQDAELVIEAIPERLDLKIEVLSRISRALPASAIIATNTSSLPVTEIAANTAHPERVIGLHFFNPAPIMELVEVVRALQTSPSTIEESVNFLRELGKQSIIVRDTPGFATTRLGVLLGCEAIRMLEQGVASAEDIDKGMELGYRHPMGPLKLTDLVGLDVRLMILEHLYRELGEAFRPPHLLRQMVRAGFLGRKSGRGFYVYDRGSGGS